VPDHQAARLPAQQFLAGNQQAAIGQPVDGPAQAGRSVASDFTVAVQIDRNDLTGSPVGEPQSALVPARRFDISESVQQDGG